MKWKLQGKSVITAGRLTTSYLGELRSAALESDCFSDGRSYRYFKGHFYPAKLENLRKVNEFYGYETIKRSFEEHFQRFGSGEENFALLISSLPGMGKTHFTISYAMDSRDLILVLLEPEMLEKELEKIIFLLKRKSHRRFVLFFDDVETDKINWYYFRTHVGGSFALPENIKVVIASNHEFPVNVSSRGREINFPLFDEVQCQGMVSDFLAKMGMKRINNQLVSVIAADYLENFGQKKFAELSPRTLVRYLDNYRYDAKKRKHMLELSQGEMIARPDADMFFQFNVRQLRRLYGEEAIESLRDEKLEDLF